MKQPLLFFLIFILLTLSISCNNEPKVSNHQGKDADFTVLSAEEGLMELKINCYSCHNPLAPSHDELLAPPMVAVKFRYKNLYPDREAFITHMTDFIYEPTEEKAKMKQAVQQLGLMPKTLLSKEEIAFISAYIYDHQLEEPDWFAEHFEAEHGTKWMPNLQQYLEKGQQIAGATFTVLSGQLQSAMKAGGVSEAVQYCNLAAYPLVDSLSKAHQATIRRTSLKVRNFQNMPDETEKEVLEDYANQDAAGEALKPQIQEIDPRTIAFYAPIRVNEFCLQCHGKTGETLTEENYSIIKDLYPADEAIGYTAGDLRGMWSIRFKKKEL